MDYNPGALPESSLRSIVNITPAIKLAPMLFEESYPDYALTGDGKIKLLLTPFLGIDHEMAISMLQADGFEVNSRETDGNYYFVTVDLDAIEQLANYAFVNYLEPMTLIQTQRIEPFPIILVGSSFWGGLIDWLKEQFLGNGTISKTDLDLIYIMDDPLEVVDFIKRRIVL